MEADTNGDALPDCWQKGGYGSNTSTFARTTDAHSGATAERVSISSLVSGDRKLLSTMDAGACAPAVKPGAKYTLSGWYKGNAPTRLVVYLRNSSGAWSYWTSGPRLAASSAWVKGSWTTAALPSGTTNIGFGFNLTQVGTLTTDDYALSTVDTTPPDTAITAQPTSGATATDASFSFTSTEPGSTFACTFDGAKSACSSPVKYSALAAGSHTFTVAATDAAGNADPTPATYSWTIAPATAAAPSAACGKQTDWTPPQVQQAPSQFLYTPMSDAAAAACVTAAPETVAANAQANAYVPSDAELQAFHSALTENGKTLEQEEWYPRYVTGRPGIANPTTDELIQWAAHKWGIPEDWLRAEYKQESGWKMSVLGDLRTESSAWYALFPSFSCLAGSLQCYESLGITQVKWHPDGSIGAGTEPLRWKSTAFNIDFQASVVRFHYDNPYGKRAAWGDSSYHPQDTWGAIGSWFSSYPFGNAGAQDYVAQVQQHLAARDWPH